MDILCFVPLSTLACFFSLYYTVSSMSSTMTRDFITPVADSLLWRLLWRHISFYYVFFDVTTSTMTSLHFYDIGGTHPAIIYYDVTTHLYLLWRHYPSLLWRHYPPLLWRHYPPLLPSTMTSLTPLSSTMISLPLSTMTSVNPLAYKCCYGDVTKLNRILWHVTNSFLYLLQ